MHYIPPHHQQTVLEVRFYLGVRKVLRSSDHFFNPKYAQCRLSDFEYRFNRCYSLLGLIPRKALVVLRKYRQCQKIPEVWLVIRDN